MQSSATFCFGLAPALLPTPHHQLRITTTAKQQKLPLLSASASSRRDVLRCLALIPALIPALSRPLPASAISPVPLGSSLASSLPSTPPSASAESLSQRLLLPSPPYLGPARNTTLRDVIYPAPFRGTWRVRSVLTVVDAPAGDDVFGARGSLEAARAGVGASLDYGARFVDRGGGVIADRAYNVERIAAAAMGEGSVLECVVRGMNEVKVVVRPQGAGGGVFDVGMEVLRRESGGGAEKGAFWASEICRQTVVLAGDEGGTKGRQVKEVETVCKYVVGKDGDMTGCQRTLVYVVKGDAREKAARGRAVDARTYELVYTRIK